MTMGTERIAPDKSFTNQAEHDNDGTRPALGADASEFANEPSIGEAVKVIAANPRRRDQLIKMLHQRMGNAFVQKVVAAMSARPASSAPSAAPAPETAQATAGASSQAAPQPASTPAIAGDLGHGTGAMTAAPYPAAAKVLSDKERGRLENKYMGRVNAAFSQCTLAIEHLKVVEMIKSKADCPSWGQLIIAAGMKVVEIAIPGSAALLRQVGQAARVLGEAGLEGADVAQVEKSVKSLAESSIAFVLKSGSQVLQKKLQTAAGAIVGQDEAADKDQHVEFLTMLQNNAIVLYEQLREGPVDRADDAQLLVLFDSFAGVHHSFAVYCQQIATLTERFMSSHAHEIGHKDSSFLGQGDAYASAVDAGFGSTRIETVLVRVPVGSEMRYAYARRTWDHNHFGGTPGAAYMSKTHALQLGQGGTWALPQSEGRTKEVQAHAHPPKLEFLGFVEQDLVEAAVQTHKTKWLADPQPMKIDYATQPFTLEHLP